MSKLMGARLPGISWVVGPKFHGYLARYYTYDGQVRTRGFSLSRHGWDADRALQSACEWLVAQAETADPRAPYRQTKALSNTGYRGITLTQKIERNGASFWVYSVAYMCEGKRATKTLRVHLFPSQEAALAAAVAFRRAWEIRALHEKRLALRAVWMPYNYPHDKRQEEPLRRSDGSELLLPQPTRPGE